MSLIDVISFSLTPSTFGFAILCVLFAALLLRIIFCQYFHPLAKFPGPWWATSFSLVGALISVRYREPQFLTYLVKKYGSKSSYLYTAFQKLHSSLQLLHLSVCMTCGLVQILPVVQHCTVSMTRYIPANTLSQLTGRSASPQQCFSSRGLQRPKTYIGTQSATRRAGCMAVGH